MIHIAGVSQPIVNASDEEGSGIIFTTARKKKQTRTLEQENNWGQKQFIKRRQQLYKSSELHLASVLSKVQLCLPTVWVHVLGVCS